MTPFFMAYYKSSQGNALMTINEINQEMAELREARLKALREADQIQDCLNELQRHRRNLILAGKS